MKTFLEYVNQMSNLKDAIKASERSWNQPIPGANKTMGKMFLNSISAKVMNELDAPFFISYSGDMSKGVVFQLTKKTPRVFISNKEYQWNSYKELTRKIAEDYATQFNNYRQKQT